MPDHESKPQWWEKPEGKRWTRGRWEFYRDRRDWFIGMFRPGPPRGTYFVFFTLVAKKNHRAAA